MYAPHAKYAARQGMPCQTYNEEAIYSLNTNLMVTRLACVWSRTSRAGWSLNRFGSSGS